MEVGRFKVLDWRGFIRIAPAVTDCDNLYFGWFSICVEEMLRTMYQLYIHGRYEADSKKLQYSPTH